VNNEVRAWAALKTGAELGLSLYETTLAQDIEILQKESEKDSGMTLNKRRAIEFRKREKQVHQFTIDCAEKAFEL